VVLSIGSTPSFPAHSVRAIWPAIDKQAETGKHRRRAGEAKERAKDNRPFASEQSKENVAHGIPERVMLWLWFASDVSHSLTFSRGGDRSLSLPTRLQHQWQGPKDPFVEPGVGADGS
jgi:hypothetical protein